MADDAPANDPLAETVRERIDREMDSLEREHGARVLFACESGSRAWGFPSPDSDYDVRFVFAYPMERCLGVHPPREVLARMAEGGNLDLSGWEVRKALRLFSRCNLAFDEWLGSPMIYRAPAIPGIGTFREALAPLVPRTFDPRKAIHHYLGIARGAVGPPGTNPGIKRLFYSLRPLMAARWVAERRTMPPTEFLKIAEAVAPESLLHELPKLIERKAGMAEADSWEPSAEIAEWIARAPGELAEIARALPSRESKEEEVVRELDALAFEWIRQAFR